MGEYGVYRKQFYTKLVSSCHFMLYLYICSFYKRHARMFSFFAQSTSNACLCLQIVIRSSW